ncbi:uncharacterized protein At4g02000-like [Ipomoea triloba]|uniref:uncharacterized protein At4g02000-like n=1 Tax=Ipomoea triloba TaxID=35885 RepID=UPI00125E4367|nr:uncharacterized protein At4g02000-like [Ipomoea triloba]
MASSVPTNGVAALTTRWADMVLEDEDEAFEPMPLADLGAAADAVATWPVVGRFLTSKMVKLEYMRQYVLDEGPWSFDNCTLVCRQVDDGVLPGNVALDTVDMWVQLHGVPVGYTSTVILEQIGNFLGKYVKGDERFVGAPWLDFYRIRVALPIDRPLKRRMKLLKRDKTWCWVTFRYERLHCYCFFCGMMGHAHRFCLKARESQLPVDQYPYGPELRAGQRQGPRAVEDSWLVPVSGPPRSEETAAEVAAGTGCIVTTVERQEADVAIMAVAKRRREGSGGGARRHAGAGNDIVMTKVPKNLHVAGSGSQTRPSS